MISVHFMKMDMMYVNYVLHHKLIPQQKKKEQYNEKVIKHLMSLGIASRDECIQASSKTDDYKNANAVFETLEHMMNKENVDNTQQSNFNLKNNCELQQCESLQFLVSVLTSYHMFINDHEEKQNVTAFNNQHITKILNAFHHLLNMHQVEFEDIYDKLIAQCNNTKICKSSNCLMLKRNHRDRAGLAQNDAVLKEKYFNSTTMKDTAMQQFLDTIHCHYFHSFDSGYRLSKTDKNHVQHMVNSDDSKQDEIMYYATDKMVKAIKHYHKIMKKQNYRNTCSTKFSTTINEAEIKYSFGIKYFYWPYYKYQAYDQLYDPLTTERVGRHFGTKDPDPANDGYTLKDFYVEPKYKNLKDELTNKISRMQWDGLLQKATYYAATDKYKSTKSVGFSQFFGIPDNTVINVDHIMAIMVYCNFDALQAKFSETYRRIPKNESNESLIKRHKIYAHLGRLLRECVTCFGVKPLESMKFMETRLYHGITMFTQFSSIYACIKGPCSTTTDVSVAIQFSQNIGMILELCLNCESLMNPLYGDLFECEFVSDFPNEQEKFFIGSYNNFIFLSIIETPTGNNYHFYVYALAIITKYLTLDEHQICRSTQKFHNPSFFNKDVIRKEAFDFKKLSFRMLIEELYRHFPNNKYSERFQPLPVYARELIHNHFGNTTEIVLSYLIDTSDYETIFYSKVFRYLFFYDYGWIKIHLLMTLFPSLKFIYLQGAKSNATIFECESVYSSVLSALANNPNSNLRQIKMFISGQKDKADKSKIIASFGRKFEKMGWRLYTLFYPTDCIVMESVLMEQQTNSTHIVKWMQLRPNLR
eukprot:423846_1